MDVRSTSYGLKMRGIMPEVLDREAIHALHTETRQSIIKHLSKRPYTASELAHVLNKHVTTIGEHLIVLERSGIVRKKETGNRWIYYELTSKGEKFFKPAYSWIVVMCLSLLAFVTGLYEMLFVSFKQTTYSIEALQAAGVPVVQATPENIILGIIAIAAAVILFWYAMRIKK